MQDFPNSVGLYPILDFDYCKTHSIHAEFLIDLWSSHKNYIPFFQFRGKSLSEKEYEKQYSTIRKTSNVLQVIVNDFWELAIREESFGIHLGKEDFDDLSQQKKELLHSKNLLKGTSSHNQSELNELVQWNWDYSGIGPIFQTNTKLTKRETLGLHFLKSACALTKIPLCPIGGISNENLESIFQIGKFFPSSISSFSNKAQFLQCISIVEKYSIQSTGPIS